MYNIDVLIQIEIGTLIIDCRYLQILITINSIIIQNIEHCLILDTSSINVTTTWLHSILVQLLCIVTNFIYSDMLYVVSESTFSHNPISWNNEVNNMGTLYNSEYM